MDALLPRINGFEATKIIKSKFPELPLIVQTTLAFEEYQEKYFRCFLPKIY